MPKRDGRSNYNTSNGYRFTSLYSDDHDDRVKDRPSSTRRVSFKPSTVPQNKLKGRMAEMAIRSRLEEDEDMAGTEFSTSSRHFDSGRIGSFERGGRRKGSPIPKGKFGNFRKLQQSFFGWYQVTIYYGQKYAKDDVIRHILGAISPDIFIPHYWRQEKNCVVFFLDDFKIAERLQMIDRTIQMPDGFTLNIRVRSGVPLVAVDEEFKHKMQIVMAKRYNGHTRALDLSRFHADPDFKDVFCGLYRTPVMSAAVDIMEKNIPDLVALNLSDNQLVTTESFKNIASRLPNLKILYLGDNKIPSLQHLLVFRNAPIVELVLKGNPVRARYKDQSLYISEVRRKFPKLTKLDGQELEPQILFDVHDVLSLPKPKASFLCDTAGADIIRQFLEQYFIIFDSDNRQPLLDAYHEQAMMSISVAPASQAGRLSSFWKFNRNFRRPIVSDENFKIRLLKVGRLSVVSTLADLPRTQHDPQSFSVDLTLFTPLMIAFTVAGLFKELPNANSSSSNNNNNNNNNNNYNNNQMSTSDIRSFQRQYVIVPSGGGFCIRNELIFVTSATSEQAKSFLKPAPLQAQAAAAAPSMSAAPLSSAAAAAIVGGTSTSLQNRLQISNNFQTPASTIVQIPNSANVPDAATQAQMIQAMSTQSNMNLEWSKKCLEETNWDFNHAAYVFDKLNKESKIPPEAFAK